MKWEEEENSLKTTSDPTINISINLLKENLKLITEKKLKTYTLKILSNLLKNKNKRNKNKNKKNLNNNNNNKIEKKKKALGKKKVTKKEDSIKEEMLL